MTYLKESTMSSQMSEYDNVPRLSTYYLQNKENTRRAYDPSYELRYNETSPRGNMLPFKGGGGKLACESSQPGEIRGKGRSNGEMLRGVTNSPLRAFPFPNPQKEEKVLDEFYHHQPTVSSQRQQQPIRQESQRVIPKIRPQEYPPSEDLYYDHEMARVPSFFFYLLVFLAEVLLFGVLILSLVWVQFYQGGFAWREDVLREFNLHPVLMITGFIFLMGHAMLTYRLFGCCSKLGAKLLHTILYLMAVPCIVVSTIAVFDNHNLRETPIPNLYSLHSWMGVVTIGLFALQLVVGFFSFWMLLLCEQGTSSFRASLVPIHSSFGLITFMLAIATCVTGLTEKAFFSLKTNYANLPEEAYYYNAMAMALTALAIIMGYVLHNPKYPPPSPVAFVDGPGSNSHYVVTHQHGYVYREKNI